MKGILSIMGNLNNFEKLEKLKEIKHNILIRFKKIYIL